jgi:hypothetical protein
MAPRAHRGPHMDEGVVILQSLGSLMATEEMLITTSWQYEDSRAVRPTCDPGSTELPRVRDCAERHPPQWHFAS